MKDHYTLELRGHQARGLNAMLELVNQLMAVPEPAGRRPLDRHRLPADGRVRIEQPVDSIRGAFLPLAADQGHKNRNTCKQVS
jgi:hypothetical protein